MVNQFFAAFENKSESGNELFLEFGICCIAHFTGLLRHQAGLHRFTDPLRVQRKQPQ